MRTADGKIDYTRVGGHGRLGRGWGWGWSGLGQDPGAGQAVQCCPVCTILGPSPQVTFRVRPTQLQDFFSKPAYLTVSGQLNGEYYACALSNIYTFGAAPL